MVERAPLKDASHIRDRSKFEPVRKKLSGCELRAKFAGSSFAEEMIRSFKERSDPRGIQN